MSANNSQLRPNTKDLVNANPTQETSNQKAVESSHDPKDPNAQKPKTSANQRPTPVTIGHYQLGKTIGQGTFGKVKVAIHTLTGEKVAIKILEKSKISEVADVERVAREIHILKIIRHPSVVQLYEIIETPRQLFLIMEYAIGGELFDYIVAQKRVKEREACRFFQEIISGVEYIHKLNIVHRDLKPENLLLDHNKRIKIVDFGLSNTYKDGELLKTACGSPCYAAPEMIAGKRYKGLGADLWSCGVILFALVCGYLPFEDPNTSQLCKKIMAGDYTVPKFVSPECKDLIKNILTTDPTKRYTVDDIRRHPWFNQVKQTRECQGIIVGLHKIPIDYDILKQLAQFNFNLEFCEKCIDANKHNHITTSYYLLLKKHLLSGGKSNADFNSDSFDPSLLTQPNPKRIKALRNNFTEEIVDTKPTPTTGYPSKNSIQSNQSELPIDKESNRSESRSEQVSRGVLSSKTRRYVESKRSGSTGGSSSIDQEFSLNQTIDDKLNSREESRRINGARLNLTPQAREHSADMNLQKILPSVKNAGREDRESLPFSILKELQTPLSSQNERRRYNIPGQGLPLREIQTPSNDLSVKYQLQRNYPPLKNQQVINPRANRMLAGSVNKELFEEKLNEIVAINGESTRGRPSYTANQNKGHNIKLAIETETPKGMFNDSLISEEIMTNHTIDHPKESSYRSNHKNDFIGSVRPIIIQDLNNSKDLSTLDDTLNISGLDARKDRTIQNTTLDNSYIINTLNTSMHRAAQPRSQSPKKHEPFIFMQNQYAMPKPLQPSSNNGAPYFINYYTGKLNKAKVIANSAKTTKPTTAVGFREYRGRSIGGTVDERKKLIPSYENSANNSNNTSMIEPRQMEAKRKKVANFSVLNNSVLQDLSPGPKNNFLLQNPNVTMYFIDNKLKKPRASPAGETFYGRNLNLFLNSRKLGAK